MRISLILSVLIITFSFQSWSQITEIHIKIDPNRHVHKEPRRGFKIYTLMYNKSESGDLILTKIKTQFTKSEKIKISNPKTTEVIHVNSLEKLKDWISSNKKSFTPQELNLDSIDIVSSSKKMLYECDIPYDQLNLISMDSFNFCVQYPVLYGFATGWDTFEITLLEENDTLLSFNFRTDDLIRNTIDLKGYLTLQPFLTIPAGYEVDNIFSRKQLLKVLAYYRRIEQCEGYYHTLFKEEHPEILPEDHIIMKDWCFRAYLKEKN